MNILQIHIHIHALIGQLLLELADHVVQLILDHNSRNVNRILFHHLVDHAVLCIVFSVLLSGLFQIFSCILFQLINSVILADVLSELIV